jgi:predicted Ser/Thr protein kinase
MVEKYYKRQFLEENYEVLTSLGEKTEGEVSTFLVKDKRNGKIAVKKFVDRSLIHIYEKLVGMNNMHLAKIYDYAEGENNAVIIEEYISGSNLRDLLDRNGRMPEQMAKGMILQLLDALKVIHSYGIIHRDINPDNVIVSTDGVVKLIDFGIARQKKENSSRDTTILGTAGYAAPEQFGFRQSDERTDIYAVGVLLNEMLSGHLPGELLYPREPFRGVIQKCIEIDADSRFQSVEEICHALGERPQPQKEVYRIAWLPGFRSGVVWKNVVATVGYICMLIYTIFSIAECAGTWQTFLLESVAVITYIWLATLLLANALSWDERLPGFCRLPKAVRIIIRIFLWMLLFILGVMLENYVRFDMLNIPRT